MAPSSGHLLVPKVGRILRFAYQQAKTLVRTKAPATSSATNGAYHPLGVFLHKSAARRYLEPAKASRIPSPCGNSSLGRPRRFTTGTKYDRSQLPSSRTSRAISARGSAPFASTLRPNLTGGALPRSSGGYGIGRVRHFSHTGGCQAQVVQNVSAGIRAFVTGGSKVRFDGLDSVTGEKKWRDVSQPAESAYRKWEGSTGSAKGTNLEFRLSPTITALLPAMDKAVTAAGSSLAADEITLNTPSLLPALATDFARALHDLALVQHDLALLSAFGNLPLSLNHTASGPTLTIRFSGCDAETVSKLCDEVGVRRGVIHEDEEWTSGKDAEMALLFPLAPSHSKDDEPCVDAHSQAKWFTHDSPKREHVNWRDIPSSSPAHSSYESDDSRDLISTVHDIEKEPDPLSPIELLTPQESSRSGFENVSSGSELYYDGSSSLLLSSHRAPALHTRTRADDASSRAGSVTKAEDYEGVEGIYRFLRECDDARRR